MSGAVEVSIVKGRRGATGGGVDELADGARRKVQVQEDALQASESTLRSSHIEEYKR